MDMKAEKCGMMASAFHCPEVNAIVTTAVLYRCWPIKKMFVKEDECATQVRQLGGRRLGPEQANGSRKGMVRPDVVLRGGARLIPLKKFPGFHSIPIP